MARLFKKLRKAMLDADKNQADLALEMGVSEAYISHRFTGKYPWSQDDQYYIMDCLRIPYEDMYLYFPKQGKFREAV